MSGRGMPSSRSSQAVSRAPWSSGRVSSTQRAATGRAGGRRGSRRAPCRSRPWRGARRCSGSAPGRRRAGARRRGRRSARQRATSSACSARPRGAAPRAAQPGRECGLARAPRIRSSAQARLTAVGRVRDEARQHARATSARSVVHVVGPARGPPPGRRRRRPRSRSPARRARPCRGWRRPPPATSPGAPRRLAAGSRVWSSRTTAPSSMRAIRCGASAEERGGAITGATITPASRRPKVAAPGDESRERDQAR